MTEPDSQIRIGEPGESAWIVETRALDAFWQLQVPSEHRPEILRLFARIVITRPPDWNFEDIRRESCEIELSADRCFCCTTAGRRLYWHHVIQVQHGGSNTPRNLVHVCHRCHAAVHPWLDPDREGETNERFPDTFGHITGVDGCPPSDK